MIISNRKKISVTLGLAAFVILSISANKPSPAKTNGGFKNLQILPKDISDDSLDRIMDNFKAALGVHCNFCHVRNEAKDEWDFASDGKPEKDIARQMMRMTTDINSKYFNFENSTRADTISVVKCVTCHRGDARPDEFQMNNEGHPDMPPLQQGEGKPDNR